MGEYVAPVVSGLPVPWIAMWGDERVGPTMRVDPTTGSWEPEPGTRWVTREFGMWMISAPDRRSGGADFGSTHSRRQRRAMVEGLCQVCGQHRRHRMRWVIPDDGGTHAALWRDRLVLNAPVCEPCLEMATAVCPHLSAHAPLAVEPVTTAQPRYVTGDFWTGSRVVKPVILPLGHDLTRLMVGHELVVELP